jgi:RNA polymerase sigma-70 factor, ECF subfamily
MGDGVKDETSTQHLDVLMGRVAKGDRAAFSDLYAQTLDRCFAMALSVLGARVWAEDCVADTYVAVWRGAASFDPARGNAVAWILMMCRTRALDRLRRERTQAGYGSAPGLPDEESGQGADPAAVFGGFLAFGQLAEAMQRLSADQRRALELTYFQGLTHTEVAEATGWPTGTAKSHVRRALASLRKDLLDVEEEPELASQGQ